MKHATEFLVGADGLSGFDVPFLFFAAEDNPVSSVEHNPVSSGKDSPISFVIQPRLGVHFLCIVFFVLFPLLPECLCDIFYCRLAFVGLLGALALQQAWQAVYPVGQ